MDELERYSELKIFHDGTSSGTFVFDKYDHPLGSITELNMKFSSDSPDFTVTMRVHDPANNKDPEYEYVKGNLVLKSDEITIPKCIIHLFDSRVTQESMLKILKMWDIFKTKTIPKFKDVQDVIKEVAG